MKLLVVDDSPIGIHRGQFRSNYTRPLVINAIAKHFESASLLSPILHPDDKEIERLSIIKLDCVKFAGIFTYSGFADFYRNYGLKLHVIRSYIKQLIAQHDIILLYLPSPIGSIVSRCSRELLKPLIISVIGNIRKSSITLSTSKGFKKFIFSILVNAISTLQHRIARVATLVYAYGDDIAQECHLYNNNVKGMLDATVSINEIFYRIDTCCGETINILRVGWLGPVKKYEVLFRALHLLAKKGYPIRLTAVGRSIVPDYTARLMKLVRELQIENFIEFVEYVPFDQMINIYRRSDIHVISSSSEGFPRVILEGAANGLPLVATNVGGISRVIRDSENGLLIPAEDYISLANAIERIICDGFLRRRIIRGGYDTARRFSLENVSKEIADDIINLYHRAVKKYI